MLNSLEEKYRCSHCNGYFARYFVTKKSPHKDTQYYNCRTCATAIARKSRAKDRTKATAAVMRYYRRNPEKSKARNDFRNAIAAGKIIKPEICSMCKEKVKIEGHHQDYSKPFDVIWLCKSCHWKFHNIYYPLNHSVT